jgi:hypothetical protein
MVSLSIVDTLGRRPTLLTGVTAMIASTVLRLRDAGRGLVANQIIGLYFLDALDALGGTATFAIFAGVAVLASVFVWQLAPETKGQPLEAIRSIGRTAAGPTRSRRGSAPRPPPRPRPAKEA